MEDKKELLIRALKRYKDNLKFSKSENDPDDELYCKGKVLNVLIRSLTNYNEDGSIKRIVVLFEDEFSSQIKSALENEFGDDVRIDRLASGEMSVIATFKN